MRIPTFSILLLLACISAVSACASPTAATGPDDREAIARNGFSTADVGYVLFDPDSGAVLAERQPAKPFAPASVAKLPAMAAALAVLGPDHRFETTLHVTGRLGNGVLDGDLILKGGGDPSLSSEGLAELLRDLGALGVTRVTGRFLYDTSALPEMTEIDAGQPWTAGYNTGVGALSLNFNRFRFDWARPAAAGQPVRVSAWSVSDTGRVPLDSVTVQLGAGAGAAFTPLAATDGDAEGERWRFAPQPGMAASLWLPVTRPGLAAAHVFRRLATESGIALPAPAPGTVPPTATLAALHRSEPLEVLARQVLRYSNNLSAELIGLAAARRLDPAVRTLLESAAVLTAPAMLAAPRTDWAGLRLLNHSGLSAGSRITPAQTMALIQGAGPAVLALLPGEDEGKALPPGVRAKSGTLAYAKALAGTLTTAGGRTLGFAFFVTDEERRAAMDRAMDRRIAEIPPEARAWLVRSRKLQADLLELWIAGL
ncbi:D-alanyl-D-alanine carboxypeptidase/D-alanyl-D-alanine-endopeptidase (penicillin-binding protein 4) [Azospirillum brasilense]|uniref:D-alanyl-D-alanine carboxypeptidase/D-alanyl-D-alanine-endopeptidase (Penicillin-binding protein 4) n=1 Tax=Azospirillum brasilense TaxID=192 RepID=A0A560ASU1_AZOBR|nr:D-alanyl-D-alanine carboxypeptidase/D-alanyl-D-alanine-endopeptidase [Azospirillum brasilense]TWA63369.1 D-alanyl-D-alanine carboxypeptidase/D-alanyl-D-alanine-endopeptidase (penicillin-binding protein 4) [Azospirillum brasilense]